MRASVAILLAASTPLCAWAQPLREPRRPAVGVDVARPLAPFSCGPQLVPYAVDGETAIRCVKFVDSNSFAWYGEGRRDGVAYRHLGYATRRDPTTLTGYVEALAGDVPALPRANGTLALTHDAPAGDWLRDPPGTIRVGGAWHELWHLGAPPGFRHTLGRQRGCGSSPAFYAVVGADGSESASARCVVLAGRRVVAWYGFERSGAARHAQIGTGVFPTAANGFVVTRWGVSDLCEPADSDCATIRYGDIRMDPSDLTDDRGFVDVHVSGAWNETWVSSLGEVRQAQPAELVLPPLSP